MLILTFVLTSKIGLLIE